MSTPYRAIECDHAAWHECQDCDWAADYGGEDHCERTGHTVRAERWKFYEKHCEVEAVMSIDEQVLARPAEFGRALFYEPANGDRCAFIEAADSPTWEGVLSPALAAEARHLAEARIDTVGRTVYRFSMGS